MDLNSLLSVLGAMGGFKAVEWLVTFWSTRKVNERKEDAAVDGIENENERKQVAWLEETYFSKRCQDRCVIYRVTPRTSR